MLIKIPTMIEVNVTQIRIVCPVNYGEEDIPNDFPGRKLDVLEMVINIDTGTIQGWPHGRIEDMFLTVKDEGTYRLIDDAGKVVKTLEGYVPNDAIPGNYGDTIELKIDGAGKITNWSKPDFTAFFSRGNDE